ncbi:MAG: 50S ribosomal protein L20 [Candidatus Gracilibacteria bacterium]|jgi:large subunit ribosomal protein L20
MVRVKRGLMTKKRHKKVLELAKGYRGVRSTSFKHAKTAIMKAGLNAYIDRRRKKRDFRKLWTIRLNAAVRPLGLTYSSFIHAMYLKHVKLNRKVLSNLAILNPSVFAEVVKFVK